MASDNPAVRENHSTMRILFINPNVTEAITEIMAEEARRSAAPATTIVPATVRFGTQYVANRIEAAIAGHAVLDTIAEQGEGCDAVVIAAFGDPGLYAAREMIDIPVVGVSEAAFLTAYTLGRSYSMVCLTERLRRWYVECAEEHGLDGRMASARALDVTIPDIATARETFKQHLVDLALRVVNEDNAEVVIMAGGPAAGVAREIQDLIPVPTIDGVSCAVRLAEMLVGLNARPPRRGSFARPPHKPAKGLSPELMRLIAGPS
jgi:Asp/Glu/hydantoin racemase